MWLFVSLRVWCVRVCVCVSVCACSCVDCFFVCLLYHDAICVRVNMWVFVCVRACLNVSVCVPV